MSAVTATAPAHDAVSVQVSRIAASPHFKSSPRLVRLLEFLAGEVLAGRGDSLGEYRVGTEGFELPENFDPGQTTLVRSHAARLRKALAGYYEGEGRNDDIVISLPPSGYRLVFLCPSRPTLSRTVASKLPLLSISEFRGIGLDHAWKDFPATVAEELALRFSRAAHLRVIPHGRGASVLPPDFLLEGSIEQRGGVILVRSRLLEGTAGVQIWAKRHEFPVSRWNPAVFEEEIVEAIAVETGADYGRIDRHLLQQNTRAKSEAASLRAAMLKFKAYESDYSEKSFKAAELALQKFLKTSPANPEAHSLLGLLLVFAHCEYFRSAQPFPASALEHFAVAQAGDPNNPYARYGRLLALLMQHDYDAVAETAADFLSDPAFPPGITAAACMCLTYAKEATPRSRRFLAAHMKHNPEYPRLFQTASALEHLAAGDHAKARRDMEAAYVPGNWFSLILMLAIERAAGRPAEAKAARAELRRLCPDFGRRGREVLGRTLHPDFVDLLMAAWTARV